jgi:hypothetical protein
VGCGTGRWRVAFERPRRPVGWLGDQDDSAGAERVPAVAALEVLEYPGGPGAFLLYYGERGVVVADSEHPSVSDAFQEAHSACRVHPREWERLAQPEPTG